MQSYVPTLCIKWLCDWWFVKSHLRGWFGLFCSKLLSLWWGTYEYHLLLCSVNVDGVVVLLGGGEDTSTLYAVMELI